MLMFTIPCTYTEAYKAITALESIDLSSVPELSEDIKATIAKREIDCSPIELIIQHSYVNHSGHDGINPLNWNLACK